MHQLIEESQEEIIQAIVGYWRNFEAQTEAIAEWVLDSPNLRPKSIQVSIPGQRKAGDSAHAFLEWLLTSSGVLSGSILERRYIGSMLMQKLRGKILISPEAVMREILFQELVPDSYWNVEKLEEYLGVGKTGERLEQKNPLSEHIQTLAQFLSVEEVEQVNFETFMERYPLLYLNHVPLREMLASGEVFEQVADGDDGSLLILLPRDRSEANMKTLFAILNEHLPQGLMCHRVVNLFCIGVDPKQVTMNFFRMIRG